MPMDGGGGSSGDNLSFSPEQLRCAGPSSGSAAGDATRGRSAAGAKAKNTAAAGAGAGTGKAKAGPAQADRSASATVKAKPKQSKSRNGCVTCKQKRLKCDETKPTCQQCAKRQVTCGGYKKDFKWRPFEEASFVTTKSSTTPCPKANKDVFATEASASRSGVSAGGMTIAFDSTASEAIAKKAPQHARPPAATNSTSKPAKTQLERANPAKSPESQSRNPMPISPLSALHLREFNRPVKREDLEHKHLSTSVPDSGYASGSQQHGEFSDSTPDLDTSGFSPGLEEPTPLEEHTPQTYRMANYKQDEEDEEENEIEEIPPEPPSSQAVSTSADYAGTFDANKLDLNFLAPFLERPRFGSNSAEMLMGNFSKDTCGLLSIRDGPNENPWRTDILPLVHESEALYHALAAATAFHAAKYNREMKNIGLEHYWRSTQLLARDLQSMRPDIALTLTLILAFAESWDVHITTGIQHLQGAKQFLRQTLPWIKQLGPRHPLSRRIRFLCNTWVYADVIARLTSLDADNSVDFDAGFHTDALFDADTVGGAQADIDPLMGCAASLFPLIGRAANVIGQVRRTGKNTPALISDAGEIKARLESWSPPLFLHEPEDSSLNSQHAVRTAESYRWATLLFLHQAVPELPSPAAADLARNALVQVALVPETSSSTIVQIYPLLAAGCEAYTLKDRDWVVRRWTAMGQRMLIGNIDRCLEVVREVWARRDQYDAATAAVAAAAANPSAVSAAAAAALRVPWDLNSISQLSRCTSSTQTLNQPFSAPAGSFDQSGAWNTAPFQPATNSPSRPHQQQQQPPPPGIAASHTPPQSIPTLNMPIRAHQHPPRAYDTVPNPPLLDPNCGPAASPSYEPLPLPFDRTVRGRQHWIGVMTDWKWEILLG